MGRSPMIENSDRGITLNKPLAWGMLVGIMSAVWFGGTTISRLESATENLLQSGTETRQILAADRQAASALEARIRALESNSTRQDARFDGLSRSLEEVKAQQRETNAMLRQIVTGANVP